MYESFEVNRPVEEVADAFKKRADECLNLAIGSQTKPTFGTPSSVHYYAKVKPTVATSAKRTEMYVQILFEHQIGVPKDGMYYLIADAYPSGKGTRVDLYRRTKMGTVGEAIRGWASGKNMGCPDPGTFL